MPDLPLLNAAAIALGNRTHNELVAVLRHLPTSALRSILKGAVLNPVPGLRALSPADQAVEIDRAASYVLPLSEEAVESVAKVVTMLPKLSEREMADRLASIYRVDL